MNTEPKVAAESSEPISEPMGVTGKPSSRVVFYSLLPGARPPQRADRSGAGSLPTRAFRYCEPVRTGSAFGYYVFPPIDFSVIWDGHNIVWTYAGGEEWLPLQKAQFPNFAAHFDAGAPEEIKGFSPPFLGALQEPGLLQIWTGLVVRTAPGWHTLVRPPANLPRNGGYEVFEGVIETDHWFGPLFNNVRLTKTDTPIAFDSDYPLFQVQVIPREALDDTAQNDFGVVEGIEHFRPQEWDDFYDTVVRPNVMVNRPRGGYAAAARRRLKDAGGE